MSKAKKEKVLGYVYEPGDEVWHRQDWNGKGYVVWVNDDQVGVRWRNGERRGPWGGRGVTPCYPFLLTTRRPWRALWLVLKLVLLALALRGVWSLS